MVVKRVRKLPAARSRSAARRLAAQTRKPYSLAAGVSQTRLSEFIHCPQAALYTFQGWHSPTTKESLAFGGLVHDLNEGLYKRVRAGGPLASGDPDLVRKYIASATRAWRKRTTGWSSPAEAQTVELCIAKANAVYPGYCAKWSKDFDPTRWRELEGEFDVSWRGFRLKGRIDGVIVIDDELWILESKTTGRIDGSLDDALTFDFQTLFYVTAAEVALEQPVAGAIYNVIRRPGHKLKQGESLPRYTARVAAEVEKDPDRFFKRFELTFSLKRRERFEQELSWKLLAFGEWCKSGGALTWKDERACRGRWNCDWLDACSSGSMAGYREEGE